MSIRARTSHSFTHGMRLGVLLLPFVLAATLTACGSAAKSQSTPAAQAPARVGGDIADTAHYLTFHAKTYKMKYVEGWGILLKTGDGVAISDKDSSETVAVVNPKPAGTKSYATHDLAKLQGSLPKFHMVARRSIQLKSGLASYAQYQTLSGQDPVTGKRVPVVVDRYYIPGPRADAVLTLATPVGVDNVDAFRLIAESFRWV